MDNIKSNKLNVLVLGVGGNVGQGILKALALSSIPCRVVGACIDRSAFGLYTVDRAYLSPRADNPAFLDWIITTCRKESVHAVLSGVEPVLSVLTQKGEEIRKQSGAICIVSKQPVLLISDDKLETCKWLEEHGFNFPRYAASEDEKALKSLVEDCGYPLIAKPRKGKGSYGIIEVSNDTYLEGIVAKGGYIVQEYLLNSDLEYTAGCFCDQEGQVRGTIVMRRVLKEGTTYYAELGRFPEVREEAIRIAEVLHPMGTCNIQLRVSVGRPVCFEINARFSGTTPIRARLGFNEVEETLRHYVLGEPARELPIITEGIALRYWNEMYIDPKAYDAISRSGCLDASKQFNIFIENYGIRP